MIVVSVKKLRKPRKSAKKVREIYGSIEIMRIFAVRFG